MTDYATFLAGKRRQARSAGFWVDETRLPSVLFPWQRKVVCWALQRGRAALFLDTGLGKTLCQLVWADVVAQSTGKPVLILAPLAVAAQTAREAEEKLGLVITICRSQTDVQEGVNIANYEMLAHFDPSAVGGVVLDECFAPDTPIDTPTGPVAIKDIRAGDAIFNAAGLDRVADVHRREVQYVVRITIGGKTITSSPNHPYFTQRGWVGAQDLIPGDRIMESTQAMRLVRENLRTEIPLSTQSALLRDILLSEMADAATGDSGESAYTGNRQETGRKEESLVCIGQSQSAGGKGTLGTTQSSDRTRSASEDLPHIERHEAQTFRAWGQWPGLDVAAANSAGCAWQRMESGVCFVTGSTDSKLSDALQARHCQHQAENRYRSGWTITSQSEGAGSEKGCEVGFSRVDGLEVLEPGHPELEKLRDANGRIYLYDLGATRHPSFSIFGCLVHNSSILKAYTGKTKRALVDAFKDTPYRLCCTATPAPNEHVELGNHAEFLGVMPANEMLTRWFINDTTQAQTFRLKGHAERDFWEWVASWAVTARTPADLGFPDDGYLLPPLQIRHEVVAVDRTRDRGDQLFRTPDLNATSMHREMRLTVADRAQRVADIVNASDETWAVWCNTNYEADELTKRIPDAVEVRGSESVAAKEQKIFAFTQGKTRILISKPEITGYGLNFQHCHHTIFIGLSYSFEQFYQAVRRFWRFGQTHPVEVVVVAAETEGAILATIQRKQRDHETLVAKMAAAVGKLALGAERALQRHESFTTETGDNWTLAHGDCVVVARDIPADSVPFSIFSPPFSSLYSYSDALEDMGNCADDAEFFQHFDFLIGELLRVTQPGRLCAVHCKNLQMYKSSFGVTGLRDFRGAIIRHFAAAGWVYHSEVCIWTDPVFEMQRTKAQRLLYKQVRADATYSGMGMAEYLLLFRKWPRDAGDEAQMTPVRHDEAEFPLDLWQRYASPVWFDINRMRVLNTELAREDRDEKHLAPLQLDVIDRAIALWTNPGEMVFDPFAGVGSTGVSALKAGRRFLGSELKDQYVRMACRYLRQTEDDLNQPRLFDALEAEAVTA